ncbi:lipid II:glycine glycyltransferase FemX [Gabonibacter massiliensis]|uniref:lipid II:glycine glycyltransferase FemX n=1 Tax=Gabonibacter massiliensis TaxID=1720195 RepID=UPI00073F7970|nr:peptidoglycan bridge formation glycyltransferase FemA/FemB family protein [Gabonibacter massiliensis]
MIQVFNKIDQINVDQWELLVSRSKSASFFQSKECYDFYASLSFMEPFVFAVSKNDILKGVVVGYIQKDGEKLKQFFSRRAIVPGGALLSNDISEEALKSLLLFCKKELASKAIYIEFRNYNDYSLFRPVFESVGFDYKAHLNFHMNCVSEDVVKKNLGNSRKRDIRTSLRDGAEIVDEPTFQEVENYYDILLELYKTRVKTPLFPFEFFNKLYREHFGKFLLIRLKGEIIGGTVCVILKNRVVYEWFACGLDGKFKNIYPSTLATWSGIKYATDHDIPLFDMMGAGKPDEGYGVRDFKAKFGGKLVEHGRFLCVTKPLLFQIGKLGVKLLKARK